MCSRSPESHPMRRSSGSSASSRAWGSSSEAFFRSDTRGGSRLRSTPSVARTGARESSS